MSQEREREAAREADLLRVERVAAYASGYLGRAVRNGEGLTADEVAELARRLRAAFWRLYQAPNPDGERGGA